MTLENYIEGLKKFVEENPETLQMQVITSKDNEGNGFNPVYYEPSKGFYEDDEFTAYDQFEECEIDDNDVNAVCVN